MRSSFSQRGWSVAASLCAVVWLLPLAVRAQGSAQIEVDLADSNARNHLQQADAFLADRQWDEAIETLRRVMENYSDKMIRVEGSEDYRDALHGRYLNVRDYCQLRLAAMAWQAPEALALYRSRVDSLAKRWYTDGVARRDALLLERVVDQMLLSSVGDDALDALGEISLEKGHTTTARSYWEQISPKFRSPRIKLSPASESQPARFSHGRPLWLEHRQRPELTADAIAGSTSERPFWLAYPDSDLNLNDVRARLALVSLLEGSPHRARFEREILTKIDPQASGRLGGRTVNYREALAALIGQSESWPRLAELTGWYTFAGSAARNKIASSGVDIAGTVWEIPLGRLPAARYVELGQIGFGKRRVAEDFRDLLSYHPLVVDDLLLVHDATVEGTRIRAFNLHTGKPAWPGGREPGLLYQQRFKRSVGGARWGVPRMTMTVHGHKLFARTGSPITSRAAEQPASEGPGQLVGLDLAAQGRMLPGFPIQPEDAGWAFEGAPVTDGTYLYVAMRRGSSRPAAYVAAFDTETGRLRWRRRVCAGKTPALGKVQELTHNLLTLHEGTIYYNTNLGAVAALRARDGVIRWITVYPRQEVVRHDPRNEPLHLYRDLNPCLLHKGLLYVAPADCDHLFALDASTGQMIWRCRPREPKDAVHLLGAGGGNLIASGDRLWWFDLDTGKNTGRFPAEDRPDGPGFRKPEPAGYGRGVLVEGQIWWPTREEIYILDQRSPRQLRQPLQLLPRGAGGGNLVVASGYLMIATSDKIYGFSEKSEERRAKGIGFRRFRRNILP